MRRSLRVAIFSAACWCSLLPACKSEVLSLGARRCVNTDCAPIDRNGTAEDDDTASLTPPDRDISDVEPGTARLAWQADIGCGQLPIDRCTTGQSAFFLAPQWFVDADGAITEARSTSATESGVLLRKVSSEGVVLWDLSEEISTPHSASMALAPDGTAGDSLLVVGAHGAYYDPVDVYSLSADGAVEERPSLPSVGEPLQVAVVEGDVLLLSMANRTLELARYDREGRLLWRQTQLTPYWHPNADDPMSALMASAGRDAVRVMHHREDTGYEWDLVDAHGMRSQHRFVGADPPRTDAMGALFNAPDGSAIAAFEDFDQVYQVMRCTDERCGSYHVKLVHGRPAEEFYPARMLGAATDSDGNVFVATEQGPRSAPQLLIDRISSDFTERRPFVVSGLDISELTPKALAIGPHGEIYYWSEQAIGRIELDP